MSDEGKKWVAAIAIGIASAAVIVLVVVAVSPAEAKTQAPSVDPIATIEDLCAKGFEMELTYTDDTTPATRSSSVQVPVAKGERVREGGPGVRWTLVVVRCPLPAAKKGSEP